MAGIEQKEILQNRIFITPELVAAFKDLWHQLVNNPLFTSNFSLPFYHLKSEGFWHLHTVAGKEIALTSSRSVRSFAHLKEVVTYAVLDEELFSLLQQRQGREILKQTLLSVYFPERKPDLNYGSWAHAIAYQILHESSASYAARALTFDEEEIFARSGIFKKEIPRIYNYSCCISGMRIIAGAEVQLVDACHIVPFSDSHDDTISNGLSLCPNLHRAFDRGLIAVDDDYRVLVKPFHEAESDYTIRQFAGRQILLPRQNCHLPAMENLRAHRKRFRF